MRNRYLDLLRAAAIVRVIVYHLFGWPWLSIVLPAMGVMFALAGSLTAASLSRRAANQVVTSRLRRLLPPLWLLGAIAVPVMLVAGWTREDGGQHPFSPATLVFWLLPIGDPPGSDQALDVWEPLWYLRAYVWFVLLSPVLFLLWRRVGWATVALPLLIMAALDYTGFELPETADAALWDFITYGACWIAGFAHQDGRLARLRPWLAYPAALVMAAAALWWARQEETWDFNDVSESQALWSLAFVLVVLRWQPSMDWLARVAPLDRTVTLLNARAVTVYLWHNIAIAAVWPVLTVLALDDLGDRLGPVTDLLLAFALTGLAVVAFGWAEDLGARRRPRLWPDTAPAPRSGQHTTEPPSEPSLAVAAASGRTATAASAHSGGLSAAAPARSGRSSAAEPAHSGGLAAATPARSDGLPTAAPVRSGRSSAAAAMARSTAAAAMTRTPANWPPIPRDPEEKTRAGEITRPGETAQSSEITRPEETAHPSEMRRPEVDDVAPGAPGVPGVDDVAGNAVGGVEVPLDAEAPDSLLPPRHDPGLPVAGRRADPLEDEATDWFHPDRRA
ncbi:acyltransferase family protein [Actinoplanes solisilvae]|uniref:acyltransferase family protein n=1 Tax=Actinoplanes solisilvae TaxID=2486853 RepID=UPI00196B9A7D|nr:acyltransferase [Actinoplanes solisilvae]